MDIIWTIIIGLAAGIVAKFVLLGSSTETSDFVTTAILGILGTMVATFLGRTLGWYEPGQGAAIGAVVGAIIVLLVWGYYVRRRGAVPPK